MHTDRPIQGMLFTWSGGGGGGGLSVKHYTFSMDIAVALYSCRPTMLVVSECQEVRYFFQPNLITVTNKV